MKNSEIKALGAEELKSKLAETQETLSRLKFAHAVTPIENPMQIRNAKNLVARLQTELAVKTK